MAERLENVSAVSELKRLNQLIAEERIERAQLENDILSLQISNAEKLVKKKEELELLVAKKLLPLQQKIDKQRAEYFAVEEAKILAEKKKKKLSAAERKKIEEDAKEKFKIEQSVIDKENKKAAKKQKKELGEAMKNLTKEVFSDLGLTDIGGALFGGKALKQAISEANPEWDSKQVSKASNALKFNAVFNALAGFAKQIEGTVNDIANAQTEIDTRLQGSRSNTGITGSYWKKMSSDVVKYVGMSATVKQSDVITNLKSMVGQGIAFNVEQRAFLDTIADKIATTFEATDGTLLKLVRIQQEDTTAARLGMESALTSFLNNMYETTEYMQSAAAEIRANLYEASALMTAKSATEFEYQVQKWMGSLYSVGFNNTSGLSGALGKLAAGDISGISNGSYGNLLVMAANKANLSIADILSKGLDESETNLLMQSIVNYLGQIYNETKGSNILAQQYAGVFGLTASDLKAAANLARSTGNISSNNLNYGGMLSQLNNMANSMWTRTSTGGMMTNLLDNFKYATANSLANNPVLYATYTLASMLEDTVGGISIPAFWAAGSGFDLNTSVADLMRVASLGGGMLSGIGTMLHGLGQNGTASGMLRGFGITGNSAIVSRGTGAGLLTTSGATTSESGSLIGNTDSSTIKNKTITDATDEANQQLVSATEDEKTTTDVYNEVSDIYQLLLDIATGTRSFSVNLESTGSWLDTTRE